jgi:hypothetical protein
MNIRTEQRNNYPPEVENIGFGKWHLRWNIEQVLDEETDEVHYEYNEVTLDHPPTQSEIDQITG